MQGYCNPGQWLTFNPRTHKPTCQTNPCLKFAPRSLLETFVLYQGACVPLNSPCAEVNNGVVKFISDFVLPRCSTGSASSKAVGAPAQGCKPGSHLAHNGKCQPIFEWWIQEQLDQDTVGNTNKSVIRIGSYKMINKTVMKEMDLRWGVKLNCLQPNFGRD